MIFIKRCKFIANFRYTFIRLFSVSGEIDENGRLGLPDDQVLLHKITIHLGTNSSLFSKLTGPTGKIHDYASEIESDLASDNPRTFHQIANEVASILNFAFLLKIFSKKKK